MGRAFPQEATALQTEPASIKANMATCRGVLRQMCRPRGLSTDLCGDTPAICSHVGFYPKRFPQNCFPMLLLGFTMVLFGFTMVSLGFTMVLCGFTMVLLGFAWFWQVLQC